MLLKRLVVRILQFCNFYHQTHSIFHHPRKKVILPSYVVPFNEEEKRFLELSAQSFNYQVDYSLGFRQKEVFVVPLRHVTFLGNSGGLLYNGKLITESVFDALRMTKSPAYRWPAWLWPRKRQGHFTSLLHLPWAQTSNYHWFIDVLPRLCILLEETEEIKIIVPRRMPVFQEQTLRFLLDGKTNFSLVPIGDKEKWQVENFLFPSFIAHHNSGYLPSVILQQIRLKVWQGYGVKQEQPRQRLYISRSKAGKRRLLNETALQEVLQAFNFQVVFAEDLTYQQQVQLFYQAEVVVGAHGAGLTNVLFSQACLVVELHPANQVKSHYFMLCKALNFEYHYLVGSLPDRHWNFSLDPEALKGLLNEVLKKQ